MPAVISDERVRLVAFPGSDSSPIHAAAVPELRGRAWTQIGPNLLVRWAFYLSAFSIPFARLYVPGTGERAGVTRIVQLLLLCAVASQPRVCLRLFPFALLWFVAYAAVRMFSGLWFSPELWAAWWPSTFEWLQFSLPWVWVMFNLLQFPQVRRGGLWAFVWGCSLCASLHLLGIGVSAVDNNLEEVRTTVFGENANLVGTNYAIAITALIGMGMLNDLKLSRRLLVFPLIALIGLAMAKTGSRTALLLIALGVIVLLFQAESIASKANRFSAVILLGLVLAGVVWQVPTVMQRFQDLDAHNIGRLNPRARMAPVLWEIFMRSPIYGSGPDQYEMELTRRAMPYLIRDGKTIVAHNLVLLLLVETGVVGFLIFAAGLWRVSVAAWRARFNSGGLLPLALFLPFLISGMLVNNPSHYGIFWLAVAYALAGTA
jgi:O-antigen ligase